MMNMKILAVVTPLSIYHYPCMYWYTYRTRIIIKLDNNWYEVIGYVHKKTTYSPIYPSTYDVRVHMILHENILVHICYETWSSLRRPLFLHTLSFECTSKLCINFLNQFSIYFHISYSSSGPASVTL